MSITYTDNTTKHRKTLQEFLFSLYKRNVLFSSLFSILKLYFIIFVGFLGLGKSQNALYFGCCHKEKYTDALVWRCNATDKDAFHSSLKQLTDTLQISSQIIETTPTDDAIAILQDLISKELMKRATNGYHLLIIDGVSLECREVIEQFVRCFLESEQSNTKIITTTNVQYLLHDEQQLRVQGFTENESIAFLSDGHAITEQKRNDYRSLATKLGHNPLGLYLFKSYMQRYLISPKALIGFIGKREDIEMIEIDCKQSNLNFADKALFSALEFQIFTSLKNSVDPHIFQMFQMLQFLSIDDVPLLLFDFLPHESSRSSSLITNAFVNALQTNSFGDLGGEDETRFITIHSSISLTLDMHTAEDEKSELLKQLVWALNLLLNKDVFLNRDLIRQQMMLPHLRSVLKHTEKRLPSANLENQMLLIFLNDLTGYAHNFGGLRKLAGEFSEKAKQLCLEVLNESEEEINLKISKEIGCSLEKGHIRDKETMSVFKRFTSRKANYIYKKLRGIAELQKDVLKDFVPKFISTRYRVPDNIRLIEEFLGETASTLRLSDEEYNSLVEKEMAVPYEVMEKTFLPELFMAVFYTYGRRLFYIDAMKEKALAKIFIEYLFIAKELGQCMISENPNFRPLDTLLSERTGTLETYFGDHNIFEMEHDTCLEDAATRFEEMFQDTNRYYVFGVIKMKAVDDDIHKTICLKQLLRCFTKMINMESDEKNQRQIYDKGCEHAEHILQLSDDARLKERRNLPGIQVGVAYFYMAFKDAPKHILQKAEKLLLTVCPKYLIDKTEKRDIIPQIIRHENTAALGLLKCYIWSNEKEKANNLLMELKPYIAAYGSKKDQTTLSELEEENGLMDLNGE